MTSSLLRRSYPAVSVVAVLLGSATIAGCADHGDPASEAENQVGALILKKDRELNQGDIRIVKFESADNLNADDDPLQSRAIGEEPVGPKEAVIVSTPYFHQHQNLVMVVPIGLKLSTAHPNAAWCIPINKTTCARIDLLRAVHTARLEIHEEARNRVQKRIGFDTLPDQLRQNVMAAVNDLVGVNPTTSSQNEKTSWKLEYAYKSNNASSLTYKENKTVKRWQVWFANLGPKINNIELEGEFYGPRPVMILSDSSGSHNRPLPVTTVTVLLMSSKDAKECSSKDSRQDWGVYSHSYQSSNQGASKKSYILTNQIRSISSRRLLNLKVDELGNEGVIANESVAVQQETTSIFTKRRLILDLVGYAFGAEMGTETSLPFIPAPWRWDASN